MIRVLLLFVLTVAHVVSAAPAWARQPAKVPVVGVLTTHAAVDDPIYDHLRVGLRELGYKEGRNIRLEIVTAAGQVDRLPALAQDLVRNNVDFIVTTNVLSVRAAMKATAVIPIVMTGFTGDPVALGFIDSFRRPGGNVTGFYTLSTELDAKRLELLKEALPGVTRVAVFWEHPFGRSALKALSQAALSLGVQLDLIQIHGQQDLETAFETAKKKKDGAILFVWSPTFFAQRDRVAALALKARLPTVSSFATEDGALISYGGDGNAAFKRVAYYVDRLLKGAKASELPVEQFATFRLVVNRKTAKILGLTIPRSILMRAD
jgi:putative ABC transport system substrate-binding protein